MTNPINLPSLFILAAAALAGCATDDYDPGNAAQGGPVNRQASSAAESACMAAVNSQYGGKEKSLRVVRSEFSQANSEVIVQADGERLRCMVSNDGNVHNLSLQR